MKKLFKNFRIWNLCVIFIISVLCLRAFCVSAAGPSDHRRSDAAGSSTGKPSDGGGRAGQTLDAIKDLGDRKARKHVSDEETPKEMPTKVKINGDLGTPPPNSNIKVGFVPRQTYVQVRRYDTEVHLPRSAAVAEAETAEEVANAPRLREVVSHTKKQEVYEEQGYEDTAYDHGGYKKAGEHHEKKVIPREQKTDFTHITDLSTEAAQIVKIGRYSTTESSQSVTQPVTSTEPAPSRRAKRPKTRSGAAWLRHRQLSNQEKNAPSTTSAPKHQEKIPPHKRRKHKPSKSSADEPKVMDESKLIVTRKSITELDIKPTTYHPPLPTKFFRASKLYAKKASTPIKKKPIFKPPLISREGYKFEDPFDNFKDYSAIKMVTYPTVTKSKARHIPEAKYSSYYYPTQYRLNDLPMYSSGESLEAGKLQPTLVVIKPTKQPQITPQYNINELPVSLKPAVVLMKPAQPLNMSPQYRLNEATVTLPLVNNYGVNQPATVMLIRPAQEPENEYYRKIKNFPYEIVESLKKPWSEKILENFKPWGKMQKGEKRVRLNFPYEIVNAGNVNQKLLTNEVKKPKKTSSSMFGEPDNSPWIPLMPKDIYDIHGYNVKRPTPKVKKVTENELDADKKFSKKLSPIRVYDLPKVVATSYTVHHVYKPEDGSDEKAITKSTFAPDAESSNTRVTVSPDNYLTSSEVKPSYDIITAHSSDVRNTFSTRVSSTSSTSAPAPSSSTRKSEENMTPKDRESLEEIEMHSSSRYSVFHRVNATTPIESTTASLNDVNDEFNRLFLNEQEKLLFRHPHLPRETPGLIKSSPAEDTSTRNTTTTKRDIVLTNLNNGSITHLTKVSKRDNNYSYVKPFIVYPQDYVSSAKYVERLTAAHYSLPENVARNPPPLDYQQRITSLTNHLKNDTTRIRRQIDETDEQPSERESNEELVTLSISGSTTEIPVDVKKYPFYKTIPRRGLSKYSVLRYISNPLDIPTKRTGKMSFYESRKEVECDEPQPPEYVVPEREEGEWAYNPKPKLPRVQLGDKITCLKMKFFGSDPLDNPFFKEESIGFPEVVRRPSYQVTEKPEQSALNFERATKKSTKPRKKRRPRDAESPVRRWIESLAERPSRIFKRSALDTLSPSGDEETKQKVIFVGGFINRGNLRERPQKKMEKKPQPGSPSTVDSSSENEISRGEPVTDFNFQEAKRFNDALAFTSEPLSVEDDKDDDKISFVDPPTTSKSTTARSPYKLVDANNSKYLPVASRIMTGKMKKTYVDALKSLRNLRNSTTTTTTTTTTTMETPSSSAAEPRPSLQYKEPTWRYKKPEPTSVIPMQDSLLYVIHPDGQGRWMKLVRVEDISDEPSFIKSDNSVGSSNTGLPHVVPLVGFSPPAIPYGAHHIPPFSYPSSGYWQGSQASPNVHDHDQRVPCQHPKKDDAETNPTMDYDVYHISGLLKQVAPLKASGAEINNLQTTDEDEIVHEDDLSNSYYDLNDLRHSSTQFPEPHERLYYYVLDDEEKEDR